MAANITDKFNKASSGNGNYPTLAKVATARSTGDAILVCEDLTGWTTDTAVHFSTYKVNADGAVDPATQTDWKGVVSGDTITNLTRIAGAADAGNAVGDVVELNPTIGWLSDLVDGLLASHNQNGSIKAGAVTNTAIADGAVTTGKISNNSVTSDKVDFTTLAGNYSTSEQDTGYTWVDGKKIYKKTIEFGYLPNNTGKNVPHGIANLGLVIDIDAYSSDGTNQLQLPMVSTSTPVTLNITPSNILIVTTSDRSPLHAWVTVYYTKSS